MKYTIEIPASIVREAFKFALTQLPNSTNNFFYDVRNAFKNQLEDIFSDHGIGTFRESHLGSTNYLRDSRVISGDCIIKYSGWNNDLRQALDFDFCARYGHDEYSLKAVNYLDRAYCELPSILPFSIINEFSLGNILLLVQNGDYEIDIVFGQGLKATGYAHQISSRKKKSYLCIFGVHFNNDLLSGLVESSKSCSHSITDINEIMIGTISYPVLFICRRCGQLITCSCFKDHYSIKEDIMRFLPYGNSEPDLRAHVKNLFTKDGICSLCTGKIPSQIYGSAMYYSSFLQRHLPYYTLFTRKKNSHDIFEKEECKQIENEVREKFAYPRIGEKWISETTLFKVVSSIFSPMVVFHHYRGIELQGLELDIWIPGLKVGIEYQGEQHFQAIEHWGGEEGLRKRQENDKKKRLLCEKVGYTLIEFHHLEELSEEAIRKKLTPYMRKYNPIS